MMEYMIIVAAILAMIILFTETGGSLRSGLDALFQGGADALPASMQVP